METRFDPFLVVLSVLVAILASYVALNLANSITQAKGRSRAAWLTGGALAMGVGIWSMHFVGMLAFEMPGMTMAYDVPLMILSIVIAVVASALALFIVSRPAVPTGSVIAGGIAMAAAIAGMHYTGMYSMRMAATIQWNLYLVSLSVVIALIASFGALMISIRLRDHPERAWQLSLAAVVMGFAISGMHYTGMLAATFIHEENTSPVASDLLVSSGLTMAVVAMTMLILGLALAGSTLERILEARKKRTDEILNRSEERFRLLVENVKDYAIFMLDTKGNVTTWNAGAERIKGYTAEAIIGKHFSTFYPEADRAAQIPDEDLQMAIQNGHFETEALRVRADGSTFWANIVIAPFYDRDGRMTGFSKITRDITELKAAQLRMKKINEELEKRVEERTSELKHRESQLSLIANAMPVLVGQLDCEERFLFVNDAFCQWFGRTNEQVIGTPFSEILGEERYGANEPYIRKALAGEIAKYERHSVVGNAAADFDITYVPEFSSDGDVAGFILVATNVTKYKQIEAELKSAKEAAEVANAAKSAFLANMSHEIRTPLGVVLGFSELMLGEQMTRSERANSVEVIKRNGRLLSNIINDILDLSKVEAGKIEMERVDVPFTEVISDVESLLNLEATGKGITLTVTSEGAIPSLINTDPLRLRQILMNIVGNAIKFTNRGSVDVKVKLLADAQGLLKLAFVVKDTGEGMKPEQVARLFMPFTQADASTTRRFGGTGLGLILSRKLANALGGNIVLSETAPGVGSTFVVTIDPGQSEKILFQSTDRASQKVLRMHALSRDIDLSNFKVLVVDDSMDNQLLVKNLLRIAGAEVETASNGREGVEKVLKGDFSLVLMDLQMPEMDGYEATKKLREQGYKGPIIALTAHAMKEERLRCLESGFNDHLTKPIDRDLLIEVLSNYSA